MSDPKNRKFRNGQEVDFYCASGGENGTDRKLRFPAFDRRQNYSNTIRINAFHEVSGMSKNAQKNDMTT